MKKKVLQDSVILFSLNMMASLLNYCCQIFMARILSIEDFGTINIVFSFLLIISVPGNTLTMLVSKTYAGSDYQIEQKSNMAFLYSAVKWIIVITLGTFLIGGIFSGAIKSIFNVQDDFIIILMIALGALGFFHPFFSGVLSGYKKFVFLGIYALLIPVYKLLALFAAKQSSQWKIYIILVIMIAGTIGTAILGWLLSGKIIGGKRPPDKYSGKSIQIRDCIGTLIINICLMIYMNIDLIAVRKHGGDLESGLYSSVLLFGRAIYYFSTTLASMILPLAASAKKNNDSSSMLLFIVVGIQTAFSFLCTVPLLFFGKPILAFLFGSTYQTAEPYIKYICFISISLSLKTILANYMVGIERGGTASFILSIEMVFILGMLFLTKDIFHILFIIGGVGAFVCVILLTVCCVTLRKARRDRKKQ